MAEAIRQGLAQDDPASGQIEQRVQLPLVECAHAARPGEEITAERAVTLLISEEAEEANRSDR